ncbi:hypothetical protein DP73_17300 [Desulfosporosinus sp. HMP52]|uniref:hypothetical protein n=1 Tax=Desulfosporosinus sp. HMP52 TaxID=1487923 RepID=UPI00051FBFEA|nr:hypothetical protein [Desulfosporosinus sp. HMP52]KGK86250.1 hypothetical protein DP73_17300 [Desulfosporosinus sp. HMP52]
MVSVTANSLLDTQILLGVILLLFGGKLSLNHILLALAAAVMAHYSYSVEKRRGGSIATLASAWGAAIPVIILYV